MIYIAFENLIIGLNSMCAIATIVIKSILKAADLDLIDPPPCVFLKTIFF